MKKEVFNQMTEYIDALATKLGVAAEYVFELLVRQQIAEGIADSTLGILLLATSFILFALLFGAYTKAEYTTEGTGYYSYDKPVNNYAKIRKFIDDSDGFFYVLFTIAQILLISIGIACVYCGVLSLINPEYYAIKEILDTFGSGE